MNPSQEIRRRHNAGTRRARLTNHLKTVHSKFSQTRSMRFPARGLTHEQPPMRQRSAQAGADPDAGIERIDFLLIYQ